MKPIAGSLATTTDHTIQTAKESSSDGIEIQQVAPGDARARSLPRTPCPPAASPRCSCAAKRADMLRLVDLLHLGQLGELLELLADSARSMLRIARCIQTSASAGRAGTAAMKQLCQMPVRSLSAPNSDRQHKAAEPADQADDAADRADMLRVVDGDVLVDRRLAQAHEEAQHEERSR